ncbi:hypothetical protein F5Y14DRAFT_247783 [Nemania sp. NC0429]|nr:hypothetical protein F5Y14DRAFT_247783 [Nemania sp. NC0429]
MSSPSPAPNSYSLEVARRIHNTTGKEHLERICVGGFLLESLWHSGIERRVLKTPAPAVRKAMLRAAVTWPVLYVVTSACISWAARKVDQAEEAQRKEAQRNIPT